MPTPQPTPDELIAALKHSSLPTVLVEGTCDAQIYRYIDESLDTQGISTQSCGGREALLILHQRRSEFSSAKVTFLADRDMWTYSPPPSQYNDIIWTTGYSIENDIYAQETLEKLMSPQEQLSFLKLINSISRWFAFCIEEHLAGRNPPVATHLSRLIPTGTTDLDPKALTALGFKEPHPNQHTVVITDYSKLLRGKSLFETLMRILSAPNRSSKYSYPNIYEICIKINPSSGTLRILKNITESFQSTQTSTQPLASSALGGEAISP